MSASISSSKKPSMGSFHNCKKILKTETKLPTARNCSLTKLFQLVKVSTKRAKSLTMKTHTIIQKIKTPKFSQIPKLETKFLYEIFR